MDFGLFPIILNKTPVNIYLQVFVWTFIFLE